MRSAVRHLAFGLSAILLATCAAQADDRCTHESFAIDGGPVTASFCVGAGSTGRVTVSESFSRAGAAFTRSLALDAVSGAAVTRAVDDVPLDPLGSPKRLHLTIAYRDGLATVEHAMLLPGAIVLK